MKPINLRSKENEVCQTISNQEKQEIREPPKQSVSNQWVIWIILLYKMISKIQLIGNKQVTLFVKLNR